MQGFLKRFVEIIGWRGKTRRLPPFFRFTLAWNFTETDRGVFWRRAKGMCMVIATGEPSRKKQAWVKSKLATFLADRLEEHIGFAWNISKEGFEVEQVSRNEISPAQLLRMYAYSDDVEIGSKGLY